MQSLLNPQMKIGADHVLCLNKITIKLKYDFLSEFKKPGEDI